MVALVRSWQDLAKILASIPMHLGKRAKIRVTGQGHKHVLRQFVQLQFKFFGEIESFLESNGVENPKSDSSNLKSANFYLETMEKNEEKP